MCAKFCVFSSFSVRELWGQMYKLSASFRFAAIYVFLSAAVCFFQLFKDFMLLTVVLIGCELRGK